MENENILRAIHLVHNSLFNSKISFEDYMRSPRGFSLSKVLADLSKIIKKEIENV